MYTLQSLAAFAKVKEVAAATRKTQIAVDEIIV